MPINSASRLGLEIRRARMARGMTQRTLARAVGLVAHSNIGDYERGERIAPLDIIIAFERVLGTPPSELTHWHSRALEERACQWFEAKVAESHG